MRSQRSSPRLRTKALIPLILASASILAGACWIGGSVELSSQRDFLETLRSVAAIVFGVTGAWIALIYPQAQQELLRDKTESGDMLLRLLAPLGYSTAVLGLTLAFDLVLLVSGSSELLRRASFFLIVAMALLELWALAFTLGPIFTLKEQWRLQLEAKAEENRLGSTTKAPPSAEEGDHEP